MLASGAGAIGNRTIGTASAGGMLLGTIFGIIIIPGLYVMFAGIGSKKKNKKKNVEKIAYAEA
jgi:HAE1 family hydrophobic/amphiphilic exporter-1